MGRPPDTPGDLPSLPLAPPTTAERSLAANHVPSGFPDRPAGDAVVPAWMVVLCIGLLVATLGASYVAWSATGDTRRANEKAETSAAEAANLADMVEELEGRLDDLEQERAPVFVPEPGPTDENEFDDVTDFLPSDAPRIVGSTIIEVNPVAVAALEGDGQPLWTLGCDRAEWLSPFPSGNAAVEVVRCGDDMVAVDVEAGTRAWVTPLEFDPARARVGPSSVVVQDDRAGIIALDLASGDVRWRVRESGAANVAASAGRVYYSNDDGVFALDEQSGEELWRFPTGSSGLIATDSAVFVRTGFHEVHRLDPVTGASLAVSEPDRSAFFFSDFVAANDDVAVLRQANEDGVVSVFDATTAQLLWQHDPPTVSGIAVANGEVFIFDPSEESLTVRDSQTGMVRNRIENVFGTVPELVSSGYRSVGGTPDGWARLLAALV